MSKREPIKVGMLYREGRIDPESVAARAEGDGEEGSRSFEVAFSSEYPVSRWFGDEVLDHDPSSVRMGRLEDGAPLLMHHDPRDHVGVVRSARIDKDRIGRAVVELGEGPRRDEVLADIRGGILRTVSVGYRIHAMRLEETEDGSDDTYRITDWTPMEVSLTPLPADPTVGVGRSDESDEAPVAITYPKEEGRNMPEERETAAPTPPPAPTVDRDKLLADERKRCQRIREIGEAHECRELATKAVDEGWTLRQFQDQVLEEIGNKRVQIAEHKPEEVGLTEHERRDFSFVRLIRAQAFGSGPHADRRFVEDAAFEIEVSRATADKFGQEPQGMLVPPDVLGHRADPSADVLARLAPLLAQRQLTVGGTAGQSLIAEELLAGSFIDILRNMAVLSAAGITTLDGLQGNIAIPRQTGAATAYWLADDTTDITESLQTFDQVPMTPHNVGAATAYTRQLLIQSSLSIELLVRTDLARVLALALDLAGLYGTGAAGQPRGIVNTPGINAPADFAGPVPTWPEVVAMETAVDSDNALMGSLAYLTDPSIRGGLKTSEKFATSGREIWEPGDELNGYRGLVSNQVTAGDMFFGDWSALYLGLWGGLDVIVNPYSLDLSRQVRVSEIQSCDFALRHPVAMAFNNDGV